MWSDYSDAQRTKVLDKLASAGIKWVRIDFGWASLQWDGPETFAPWYIERADEVVNAARARGIKVLMTLWRTPPWASNTGGWQDPPADPGTYGRVALWMANHFKGRVAAWEVWNEPNLPHFYSGTPSDYAALLRASYSNFKAGDPQAKVVAGSVVYNDDEWLRQMYEAGARGYFDVLSTHPYQAVGDLPPEAPNDGTVWRMSHLPAVHRLMCDWGDCNKPIWFTEFGWSSHNNWPGIENWQRGVTEARQANYALRAIKYVRDNFPYVEKMFWYRERNGASGDVHLDNYGLLKRDLSGKPVYRALKNFLT